jgi:hypothetical protein
MAQMIRVKLSLTVATLAVSALTLAACGSAAAAGPTVPAAASSKGASATAAPAPADSTVPSDPCTLISPQEASAALGHDAGTPSGNSAQCAYSTPTGAISVTATHYPNSSSADMFFASTRGAAMSGVPGFQDVSGIGDHAFVSTSGLMGFEKGSTVVLIQVLSSGETTAAMMTTLGQAAAGRI